MGKLSFFKGSKAVQKAQEKKAELNKKTRIIVYEIEGCQQCPDFGNLNIQQSGAALVQCRKKNPLVFEYVQAGLLEAWYNACNHHPEKDKLS
jgi:hypothetical protein